MTSTRGHGNHRDMRVAGRQESPGSLGVKRQRGGKELPQTAEEEESEKNSRTHTHETVL